MSRRNDELIEKYGEPISVFDHGMVRLVDLMGDDAAVVQAARVSYGTGTKAVSEDRGLIRYLVNHRHTSPIEMNEIKLHCKLPIFVARQWIRHRTACLASDVPLQFDLPGGISRRGNQLYKLTVKEVFDRFQPTENVSRPDRQSNPFFKRDRVQGMNLRCMNERTGEVTHTHIVDIWESGVKDVYLVSLKNGAWAKMSADHLCLTSAGWKRLKEAVDLDVIGYGTPKSEVEFVCVGPGEGTGVVTYPNQIDESTEEWMSIPGWEEWYAVSNQGRVKRVVGGRGTSEGKIKLSTVTGSHAVVSLNRPGMQATRLVHQLVLEAFQCSCPDGMEACHRDGNGLNNTVENLYWGTKAQNAEDRVRDGATTSLRSGLVEVDSISYVGKEMTYDLEVEGKWHNFSANGMIVHNSVNEMSGRYSILPDEMYQPEPEVISLQSETNRQGREPGEVNGVLAEDFLRHLEKSQEAARESYEDALEFGVARELARIHLPVSQYTEWYWKIDLRNLLHFLSLRLDSHAQYEIRIYAEEIAKIVKDWCPLVWEAFEDYQLNAVVFSAPEQELLVKLLGALTSGQEPQQLIHRLSKREVSEFMSKGERVGVNLQRFNGRLMEEVQP